MRDASDMPELEKDQSTLGMNRIDDIPPSLDLLFRIDAGRGGVAASRRHHGRGLGDDQTARRGALAIIFRVQRPRRET
jgi:hypothetical protein